MIVFNYYKVLKNLSAIKRKNRSSYFEKKENVYQGSEIKEKLVTAYFHGHPFPANLWGKAYKREYLNITEKYVKNIKFLGDDLYVNMEILLNVKKVSLINETLYFYRTGGNTSKYMPYFFNDIIEGYKSQKLALDEYYEKDQHRGGISIMLLNSFKSVLYNLFLGDLSEEEIRKKIIEYVNNYNLHEAIEHKSSQKFFDNKYLEAIEKNNVDYLYNIGFETYKNNRIKRILY